MRITTTLLVLVCGTVATAQDRKPTTRLMQMRNWRTTVILRLVGHGTTHASRASTTGCRRSRAGGGIDR